MSKLFYDHLIKTDKLESHIKAVVELPEEREELWQIVDELIHHTALECILDHLHEDHHEDFLNRFHEHPHTEDHIHYLQELVGEDVEEKLAKSLNNIIIEIEKDLH